MPVQAWTGPEYSRLPDLKTIGNEIGKFVSPKHRPPLNPGNIPGTHFCWRLSRHYDHSAAGRIISMKIFNYTTENRNPDLPACSVVPQPSAPLRDLKNNTH
jgi:hypothetical protein